MKNVVVPGILLAGLVTLWMFVMGFTGWYKHPTLSALFFVVIAMEIGVLVWALQRSSKQGGDYWKQVGRGLGISVIAGVLIVGASLLFTTVAFPHYFEELRAIQVEMLKSAGKTDGEIKTVLDQAAMMQTPLANAIAGCVGTIVTGLLASLVIALFAKGKKG